MIGPRTGPVAGPVVGRWQRVGLRARLLLVGLLGVAVALAVGSLALYAVLGVASFATLDRSADATATEVADLVQRGRLPDPIPVTGSQVVQVLDPGNRVASASVNGDRLTALLLPHELRAALAGEHPEVSGSRAGLDSPLRVTAVRTTSETGAARTVVVAQELEDVRHSQRILGLTLLATYPLLLAVLGLIAWRVIGATLRPVETLRSAADRISGTGQDVRLPVAGTRDEVRALAETLNSMLDRLATSRARQRAFVADAAHELRSPLASMSAQLEIAERLGEAPTATPDLQAEVRRMTALVEDLLVLARADAVRRPDRPVEPVGLAPLLTAVAERYADARVPVTLEPDVGGVVLARAEELRRVLANLVDNAVRHARTSVRLGARPDDRSVVLEVADDGTGIPSEDRERVFERFTRLDEARGRDAGGNGLGLPIVRELVHRSGGTVTLEESASGGLAAVVRLPAATDDQSG